MASFKAHYFSEHGDAEPTRIEHLQATERGAATSEADAGLRPVEKKVEVIEDEEGGDFRLDGSELGGPDRLG